MPICYPADEVLKEAVNECLEGQTEDFYFIVINSLPEKMLQMHWTQKGLYWKIKCSL